LLRCERIDDCDAVLACQPHIRDQTIATLPAPITAGAGPKVQCEIDGSTDLSGTNASGEEMHAVNALQHDFHREGTISSNSQYDSQTQF
jgi:hypothetical protein